MTQATPEQQEILKKAMKKIRIIMQNFSTRLAANKAERDKLMHDYSEALKKRKIEQIKKELDN